MVELIRPIAEETVILPELIADNVVHELGVYLYRTHGTELQDHEKLVTVLADRAEHLYRVRPDIRKKFRRNNTYGRDWLYTFMRHWLAAELKDSRIPARFANGEPLWNHKLTDILALGLSEVAAEPTRDLPTIGRMRHLRAHRAFRLEDDLWHYFRYVDAEKARQADLDFDRPMMPETLKPSARTAE